MPSRMLQAHSMELENAYCRGGGKDLWGLAATSCRSIVSTHLDPVQQLKHSSMQRQQKVKKVRRKM